MDKRSKAILLVFFVLVAGLFLNWKKSSTSKQTAETKTLPLKNTGTNLSDSFIQNLRNREYKDGQIKIEETLSVNNLYARYLISYLSDGLKIYGIMNQPRGNGPFPVIILNHGYFNSSSFNSGDGTDNIANILANEDYITLASDYRGFGKSENDSQGSRGHNPSYAIDVLNLIASVKNLEKADSDRIGMWGHSMGGEVSIRTAEVTDKIKTIVLWAPTSTNPSDNAAFYGRGRYVNTPSPTQKNSKGISQASDLQYISAPISLHQGLADVEVDPQWSKNLYDALRKEGKKIEFFEYKGQDHNFRNLGWDEISQNTLEFFDRYLK